MKIYRHVRPVKLTWPGVTYLACNSGHVRRLTWPRGLTWLVTQNLAVLKFESRIRGPGLKFKLNPESLAVTPPYRALLLALLYFSTSNSWREKSLRIRKLGDSVH